MSIKADFLLRRGVPVEWIEYVRNRCAVDVRDHYFFWEAYQLLDLLEKAGAFPRGAWERVKGLKILDAGCGFGVVDCLLVMMGGDLTLLDYDMEYLNKSRDAFRNLKLVTCNLQLIKGDILNMPFNPSHPPLEKGGWEGFDLVWNGGVIEHFERPSEAIKKMAVLTKPGGYVFVSVPALFTPHTFIIRPHRRRIKNFYFDIWGKEKSYTEGAIAKEMKSAGLKDILTSTCNIRRTFLDDYVVVPRLKRFMPNYISQAFNFFDRLEMNMLFLHYLGFTVGAIGRKA